MANTFSQINIHAIFTVAHRQNNILLAWQDRLVDYMGGIIREQADFCLAVGGWKDHVHIFFEQQPSKCTSDILRAVKSGGSQWINNQNFTKGKFAWQEGYGAFSYAKSQRSHVINYVENQEEHHRKQNFREEYLGILSSVEIDYNPKYLFEFFD